MKLFNTISNLVAAGLMLFFSMTKLVGGEEVKANFKLMESLVPIDIDVFRMFTGVVELSIGLLLIMYTLKNKDSIGKLAYVLLIGTMAGALVMEFVAKPEPMIMMAVLAVILFALSAYKLKTLFSK